jgi:hypothetical protein
MATGQKQDIIKIRSYFFTAYVINGYLLAQTAKTGSNANIAFPNG